MLQDGSGSMDDTRCQLRIFLSLGKKEFSAAKGCTSSLTALKDRSYICEALRPHISYLLWYE